MWNESELMLKERTKMIDLTWYKLVCYPKKRFLGFSCGKPSCFSRASVGAVAEPGYKFIVLC